MTETPKTDLSDFFKLLSEAKNPSDNGSSMTETVVVDDTVPDLNEELFNLQMNEVNAGLFGGDVNQKTEDPLTPLNQNYVTFDDLQQHYKTFVMRVQQQLSTIGGGGETHFLQLDDVNRFSANDNWVLEYDTATGKVQFTHNIGPINTIKFDLDHVEDYVVTEGTICWSNPDRTMNIHHQNGVTQQVGQETYFLVKNVTGSDIPNGTFCRFDGVTENGINRLDAAPFLADGTYPNLFGIGVATENIADNGIGFVTNFGVVRGLNTTGSDVTESWQVGDILYANPTLAGKLTRVKPTAPNNVLPVAAVMVVDSDQGEIFVRPTLEQRMDYSTVSSSADQPVGLANTPKAITYNTLEFSNGIGYDSDNPSRVVFTQSGLYAVNFNAQVLSTNSSAKNVWFWYRKNGVDVPYSARVITITGNNEYKVFHVTHNISLDGGDYIEFMFAASDPAISLKAVPATAFAPSAPSAHIHIDQGAL